MAGARSVDDNSDEIYVLCRVSKESRFFKSPSEEWMKDNKEKLDELNTGSASCTKFKLSEEEQAKCDEYQKAQEELDEELNKIGKMIESYRKMKDEIAFCDDPELQALLNEKINPPSPWRGHKIECQINKLKKIVNVTIYDCEDKKTILEIFKPLLKGTPQIEGKGSISNLHDHSRIVISFALGDRDNLIEGLKIAKQIRAIPEARKYYCD